jgi:hypothetical protein
MFSNHEILSEAVKKDSLQNLFFSKNNALVDLLQKYKNQYNLKNHGFLKFIKPDPRNAKGKRTIRGIVFNNTSKMDSTQKTLMSDRWAELLNETTARKVIQDANPNKSKEDIEMMTKNIVSFAKNLAVYAIVSSGMQSGVNTFIDLVPHEFYLTEAMNMRDFMKKEMANMKNDTSYFKVAEEQVIRNTFTDIVDSVKVDKKEVKDKMKIFLSKNPEATYQVGKLTTFKTYVKAYKGKGEFVLMKLVNINKNSVNGKAVSAEYEKVQPLGEKYVFTEYYANIPTPESLHPDNQGNNEVNTVQVEKIQKDTFAIGKESINIQDFYDSLYATYGEKMDSNKITKEVLEDGLRKNAKTIMSWKKKVEEYIKNCL